MRLCGDAMPRGTVEAALGVVLCEIRDQCCAGDGADFG